MLLLLGLSRLRLRGRRSRRRAWLLVASSPRCAIGFLGGRFFAFLHVLLLFFYEARAPSFVPLRCARRSCVCTFGGMGAGVSCMLACEAARMRVVVCVARGGSVAWLVLRLWCNPV